MKKDGLSEDLATDAEKEVQEMTNTHIAQIDKLLASKEKEVMSV
jgi:ribosome recycling factor